MDINSVLSIASGNGTSEVVATQMLKKSQDLVKDQAAALLQAMPKPASFNSGVGGGIDLYA